MTVGFEAATLSAKLAGRDPAAAAVVHGGAWTTSELLARGAAAAEWLDQLGVPPGGLVPAVCASSPDALALLAGALGSGRVLAPLGTRLAAPELAAALAGLEAAVVVADDEAAEAAGAAAAQAGRRLAILPTFDCARRQLDFSARPEQLALVLHTGGTTGQPRRVDVRPRRLAARVLVNSALLGLDAESVYATASGFHHIAGIGMLVVALGSGAATVPALLGRRLARAGGPRHDARPHRS